MTLAHMTLDQWALHLEKIYGINNVTYFTSLSEKIGFLIVQARALQDVIRKEAPRERQGRVLSHAFAWTFAVANHCRFASVAAFMCEKYPAQGCGYCLHIPCRCDQSKRREHNPQELAWAQLAWDLSSWQEYFKHVYGDVNRRKGIENALNRLFAEIGEVTHILTGVIAGSLAHEIQHEYGLELADLFAWIFGIAVLLGIDLSATMSSLYFGGCPCCSKIPCECPKFLVVDNKIVHAPHLLMT